MRSNFFKTLLLVITISFSGCLYSQPFANEIAAFKKADSITAPPAHPILFVGSSSFTKWTDVQNYFPDYTILNRGFGGSTLQDVIRYADDVIFKYDPKQIVIYCGENDFASSDTVTVPTVIGRFTKLYNMIREHYKNTPVAYVSMKPSPSRAHLFEKYKQANAIIKTMMEKDGHAVFINVYDAMLGADGKPLPDIFIEDNLHMNAKGYAIWQKIILPYLVK